MSQTPNNQSSKKDSVSGLGRDDNKNSHFISFPFKEHLTPQYERPSLPFPPSKQDHLYPPNYTRKVSAPPGLQFQDSSSSSLNPMKWDMGFSLASSLSGSEKIPVDTKGNRPGTIRQLIPDSGILRSGSSTNSSEGIRGLETTSNLHVSSMDGSLDHWKSHWGQPMNLAMENNSSFAPGSLPNVKNGCTEVRHLI